VVSGASLESSVWQEDRLDRVARTKLRRDPTVVALVKPSGQQSPARGLVAHFSPFSSD
jgi:hypothetical protein